MKVGKTSKGPPWWRSSRYLLAVLAALGYAVFFLQRVNLSMAIVCMVNHTAVDILTSQRHNAPYLAQQPAATWKKDNSTSVTPWDMFTVSSNETFQDKDGTENSGRGDCATLRLNETDKEVEEHRFTLAKTRKLIVRKANTTYSNRCLVIQGLATALGVSAVYAMWGTWAPVEERATLVGIVFTGNMFANAVVFPTSALLCRHGFAGGWPSVFYVFGIVGFLWCILWVVFVFETPETHPRIDPREKKYIMSTSSSANNKKHTGPIPWLKICTSLPVWGVIAAQMAYNWPFFMLLTVLPQYMKEVLKFDIQSNGFYVMLPYISLYVFTNLWSYVAKVILSRKLLSVNYMRKLSAIVGDVIPCTLYIIISFLDCSQALTVVFLMALALGISGTNLQGYLINPYDIAPRYATAIFSISNTVSVGSGIISPYVVAALTIDKTREQWQSAFFCSVGISLVCLLFYLVVGTATEMDWAKEGEVEIELVVIDSKRALEFNLDSDEKIHPLTDGYLKLHTMTDDYIPKQSGSAHSQ